MQTLLLAVHIVLGLILIWLSNRQPFPEISRRFGILLLLIAGVILAAIGSPRPMSAEMIMMIMTAIGGGGVLIGVRHMAVTHQDVLMAPFAGVLLCGGATGLLVGEWPNMSSRLEEIGAFLLICLLGVLEVYLVFRGLLIGRLSRSWSQAGLRQLQRGMIHGDSGAIACFERGWDVEDEHLNPMAYIALERIHRGLGEINAADDCKERLDEYGGESSVADAWKEAIEAAVRMNISSSPTDESE